jgi:hypothetical protein
MCGRGGRLPPPATLPLLEWPARAAHPLTHQVPRVVPSMLLYMHSSLPSLVGGPVPSRGRLAAETALPG